MGSETIEILREELAESEREKLELAQAVIDVCIAAGIDPNGTKPSWKGHTGAIYRALGQIAASRRTPPREAPSEPNDLHEKCEGCSVLLCMDPSICFDDADKPCTLPKSLHDYEGVPLCQKCWDEMTAASPQQTTGEAPEFCKNFPACQHTPGDDGYCACCRPGHTPVPQTKGEPG